MDSDHSPSPSAPGLPGVPGAAGSPAPPRKRHILRRALLGFAGLLTLLVLLIIGAAVWLFGTESGARFAFEKAAERLRTGPTRISAQGVHGSLAGPLRIDALTVDSEGQTASLRDVRLVWRPAALRRRELHIESLSAGRLDLVSKIEKKSEPATLPASLRLPFTLRVDSLQVDGGSLAWGPVPLIDVGGFALRLDYDGTRYRAVLDSLALQSSASEAGPVAGNLRGELTLGDSRPFPLAGRFFSSGDGKAAGRAIRAQAGVGLDGSLQELRAALDLAVNERRADGGSASLGRGDGTLLLRPFADKPLGKADVRLHALDLAALSPGLPSTALEAHLQAGPDGAGTLALDNAAAGPVDQKKLPLSALRLAFLQDGKGFVFRRIEAALGTPARPAGTVTGNGSFADGALTLSLATKGLDLQRVHGKMRKTRLAGSADLRHADNRQTFAISLSEPLQRRPLKLDARGMLADARVRIDRAELRVGEGSLLATGEAALEGRQEFRAQGSFRNFRPQDVGEFGQLPAMNLNGDFTLGGRRAPGLEADLSFSIADSMLAGNRLQGAGEARLRAERIDVPKLNLSAGDNRLSAQGRLAERGSTLDFKLNAPRLEQLGAGFGGSLDLSGTASGTPAAPRIVAQWKAAKLTGPRGLRIDATEGRADVRADRRRPFNLEAAEIDATAQGLRMEAQQAAQVTARARVSPQPNAPLALDMVVQNMQANGWRADRISMTASGTTAAHAIQATLAEPGQTWNLRAAGGLRELAREPQWQGTLDAFEATGRFGARLTAPATLLVSQPRIQLDRFRLEGDIGRVMVEQFRRDRRGIDTRGQIDSLNVASLLRFVGPDPMLSTDLLLDGDWDLSLGETPKGSAHIRRRQGDVTMLGAAPVALGLRTLEAEATAGNGRLTLRMQADGSRLGSIRADAATSFVRSGAGMTVAPGAPLTGSARIDLPGIGWIGPLISPTLIADGRVQSNLTVRGSVADPQLAGSIRADGLRLFFTDTGVDLRGGTLDSEFNASTLQVNALRFVGEGSDGGRLTLSGPIGLDAGKPSANLALLAERYRLLNRSDRRLTISGNSRIAAANDKLQVTGSFQADSGFFDIGRQGAPTLSEDVVVVRRGQKTEGKAGGKLAPAIDVNVSLGDGVTLRGRGLNALLRGQLRIQNAVNRTASGPPISAQGTIQVAKGTYSAYGRELAIEQGLLRFTGPISNPALDILAMRRNQEVEAGVSVGGTVLVPRVTLVSEPVVPDVEKLSWLVLGRGMDTTGQADLGALQTAAAALLSGSAAAGIQSKFTSAFGLDTLSVSQSRDNLQQRVVTLGKQVSQRLYVSFQQGLETASSVVLLRYILSPRLTVEAETGARNVLSLFYNLAFD